MDHSIPFGYEQTIPGDKMVSLLASMVPAGSSVMEIGCGSGKLASVLAGKCRDVVGVEVQELPQGYLPANVTLIRADGCKHDTGEQFDCIVVSFGTDHIWPTWPKQLRIGGLLIVPLQNGPTCSIRVYQKSEQKMMELIDCPAYASFTNEIH